MASNSTECYQELYSRSRASEGCPPSYLFISSIFFANTVFMSEALGFVSSKKCLYTRIYMIISESKRGRLTREKFSATENERTGRKRSRPVLCSVLFQFISLLCVNLALKISAAECNQCND